MSMASKTSEFIASLLRKADVDIDGHDPWDIQVHDERMYARVLAGGSLALGESYMDGWWDCERLDEFFHRILRARLWENLPITANLTMAWLRSVLLNPQTIRRSRAVAETHYDLGNDFYQKMLDPYMQYSCGYFKDTEDLATAQKQKLDLICRKLQLKRGEKLLDIGCGWGGLSKFAAEEYGCSVVGVTISTEQMAIATEMCKGLPVEIRYADYRTLDEKFDKVVSVGMFEHVGPKNYETYMAMARHCLKDDGIFLLHTIGRARDTGGPEPWIEKYIFRNSILPSPSQLIHAAEKPFVLEDWHNFGAYYDKTLMAWRRNFTTHWPAFKDRYGERFKRMWDYYLLSCAGSFRSRTIQLWQVVLSPHGVEGGYTSIR